MNRTAPRYPQDNLSAEIIKWVEGEYANTEAPAQGALLTFRDPRLERAYLRAAHKQGWRYIAISMSIACALVLGFIWLDPWLLPPELINTFRVARLGVMLPACVLLTMSTIWTVNPISWTRLSAVLIATFGLVHTGLLLIGGVVVYQYLELGMLESILACTLLIGLPVRWSIGIVLIFGLTFAAATLRIEPDGSPFVNFLADFIVYSFLGVTAAYRHEGISRRAFVVQALSRKDYTERLAADAEHRRWLEVIAAFLRHELKNSMTAIGTSLELADRAASHGDVSKFLDRGRRSLQSMGVLLSKVAEATSLESALQQQEFEVIDFSQLINDRCEDFRTGTSDRALLAEIEPHIHVTGHGDSLTQMFDKLVNNALEHGDPRFPIQIQMRRRGEMCHLAVSDVGDALPDNLTEIFEPFVTAKSARAGVGHLGLGLFIARTIAANHGGTVRGETLSSPVGASFVVELPLTGSVSSDTRDRAQSESGQRPGPVAGTPHESL